MRKVAIIRRNGLGDLLLCYPLICLLKKKYPETSITLFVDERNAPLLPYFPSIFDKTVVFPKRGNKYINTLSMGIKFRKEKFDVAISAKTSPMKLMNFFLGALGAQKTIAYTEKNKWSNVFVSEPRLFDQHCAKNTHQALKGVKLLEPNATTVNEELYPKLCIPEEIKRKYPLSFQQSPLRILMTATTTNHANRIDEKKYASLINCLYESTPFSVVLVAQKEDEQRALRISEQLKVPNSLFFPRNFDEFMVSLSLCDVYFVPDGGIAHIGAGLRKKLVVLFGSTSPIQWAPLSQEASILYHPEHVNTLSDEEILKALEGVCKV